MELEFLPTHERTGGPCACADTHTHILSLFSFLRTHRETQICMYIQIQVAVFPIDRIRAHLPSTRESDMFSNSPLFIFITSRYNQSERERERESEVYTHRSSSHFSTLCNFTWHSRPIRRSREHILHLAHHQQSIPKHSPEHHMLAV